MNTALIPAIVISVLPALAACSLTLDDEDLSSMSGRIGSVASSAPPMAPASATAPSPPSAESPPLVTQDAGTAQAPAGGCVARQMGPRAPSVATNIAGGLCDWSNPLRAATNNDGQVAACQLGPKSRTSELLLTGFGFSLPENATVQGIRVTVNRRSVVAGCEVRDAAIRLAQATERSDDRKAADWPAAVTSESYGGATDQWALTLTPENVNAADFGVGIEAESVGEGVGTAQVDGVMLTVFYCAAP